MKRLLTYGAVAIVCFLPGYLNTPAYAQSQVGQGAEAVIPSLPAGTYRLDKSHASLVFKVGHLGFSNYTGGFDTYDATLELDPRKPAAAKVTATIDLNSLRIPTPPRGFVDELLSERWLGAVDFPEMTFESTSVTPTGPLSAEIQGRLTLKGISQPVVLQARFNGGYPRISRDPRARIGFSAHGTLKRSAFGVNLSLPGPGTTMGVSDQVTFEIEAEFSGPRGMAQTN